VTRLFSLAQKSHCDATVFFGTKITLWRHCVLRYKNRTIPNMTLIFNKKNRTVTPLCFSVQKSHCDAERARSQVCLMKSRKYEKWSERFSACRPFVRPDIKKVFRPFPRVAAALFRPVPICRASPCWNPNCGMSKNVPRLR
jgi:hypothetical protein